MLGALNYFLIILLAFSLRTRLQILRGWKEPVRLAAAIAIVQYAGAWLAFLAYLVLGMGPAAFYLTGAVLLVLNAQYWTACRRELGQSSDGMISFRRAWIWLKANIVFISFVALFCVPFVFGLSVAREGQIHFRFNFIDSAFHLSLSQSFLTHPHFPPLDLNAAGRPLVYHFMADFLVAFLSIGGLDLARTMHGLNICNAVLAAIVLWGVVDRLLKNPRPLVTGAVCAMFCFLMPVLANALHWYFLKPAYFSGSGPWARISYPYFNFEYIILNLLEPQRPFLFALPVILVIMDALCALWGRYRFVRMLETVWLYALLPFCHTTSFLVLGGYFAPLLILHRKRWVRDSLYFLLPGLIVALQVLYIRVYVPGFTARYSGWDALPHLPLQDFQSVPALLRHAAYWLLVDGEFLVLGGLGLATAFALRRNEGNKAFFRQPVLPFLGISFCFFLLINFYRFSRNWGDSNKFVMFLNFWLSLVFGQMLAVLTASKRAFGKAVAFAVLGLAAGPYLFDLQIHSQDPSPELFSKADALAALWVAQHTEADDVFVTTPLTAVDFIPALAGRAALHGMYINTQPYYDPLIEDEIRRLYENADFEVLRKYSVKYVRVSALERRQYHLNPIFGQSNGLAYSDGPQDYKSIRIYNATALMGNAGPGPLAEPTLSFNAISKISSAGKRP